MDINLISVTSPKGGGKDIFVKIIQLIELWYDSSTRTSFRKEYPNGIVEFVEYHLKLGKKSSLHLTSKWENKKFGYKLKQVASILLGVPVEKFEDREFKESLLGEEWNLWRVTCESLGKIQYNYYSDYELSKRASSFFDSDNYLNHIKEIRCSVRLFIQLLGTQAMRKGLHKDCWINGLFSDYKEEHFRTVKNSEGIVIDSLRTLPHWIISDTRFTNELQAVKDKGGITVKIDSDKRLEIQNIAKAERLAMIRLTNENDSCFYEDSEGQYHLRNDKYQAKFTKYYNQEFNKLEDTHESETAWRDWKFDYVIDNNKDIPHLIKEVEKFYKHYNLDNNICS